MNSKNSKIDFEKICFYSSLCLFLSAIEYAIPKPLPFMRLGLANLPVLLSLKKFDVKEVLILVVFKIIGQAVISGTLLSYVFLFSVAGSCASALVMIGLYYIFGKGRFISLLGISVGGALANNLAQLGCARLVMFGDNTKYVAPVLLISGFVTGIALGIFAVLFEKKSSWFNGDFCQEESKAKKMDVNIEDKNCKGKTSVEKSPRAFVQFYFCLVSLVVFMFVKNVYAVWGIVAFFFAAEIIMKKGKVNFVMPLVITLSVTFFALLDPFGKVLVAAGPLKITEGSLVSGLMRSGKLVGMVMISQCAFLSRIELKGKVGKVISQILFYFEELTSSRIKFNKGNVIEKIDERLIYVWNNCRI